MQSGNFKGCFIAVVGPSGAGKDTILDAARETLKDDPRFYFVRRIITRPSMADTEDHDSLDEAAFVEAMEKGAFALSWQAHGLHYALPQLVNEKIAEGTIVIANVSRRVLDDIRKSYPCYRAVMITAHPDILAKRLAARGRETSQEISARLEREVCFDNKAPDVIKIDNSNDVATAIEAFIRHLRCLKTEL